MPSFLEVKAGDKIKRMLADTVPMVLTVEKIDDDLIHTYGGWMFDRKTGAEVDPDLGWGPPPAMTGSFLVKEN